MWLEAGALVSDIGGTRHEVLSADRLALPGAHNLENALAAVAAAEALGTPMAAIRDALTRFSGLPHRTELVAEAGGIRWIDDSKGTNVDATAKSLEGFADGSVILILGGRDKHGDFAAIAPLVAQRARAVLTIGEAAETIETALRAAGAPIERCGAMPAAVERAAALARPGDTVLLSPACASFDQYRNFEERGRHFAELARAAAARGRHRLARKLASDKILFGALVALSLFGCVMIYSASAVSAGETSGNPYRYLLKQIAALAVGGIAAFFVYRTDYRKLARPWVVYGAYAVTLLLAAFALFRPPINGARRWIPLGVTMLQPSELLKVALVLVLAYQLSRKSETAAKGELALLPALVFSLAAAGVVVLQPDFGTAACYVMLCAVLLWLAGARPRLFLYGLLALIPALAAVLLSADYRRARILAFINPEADPLGKGFQAIQSLIAVGAGGWFGNGLGGSRQKLFFLPFPHTDFIFAIVGEELGFVGAAGLVACFGIVAWRGLRAARRAPDAFAGFLAAGATAMIVVQAAINLSVVLAPAPDEGHPASVRFLRRLVISRLLDRGRADPQRLAARGSGDRMNPRRSTLDFLMSELGAFVIAAGGTGGHIVPGLALAQEIRSQKHGTLVVFVGTSQGLETKLIPAAGFPLELVDASGFVGKTLTRQLGSLAKLPKGFLESRALLKKYRAPGRHRRRRLRLDARADGRALARHPDADPRVQRHPRHRQQVPQPLRDQNGRGARRDEHPPAQARHRHRDARPLRVLRDSAPRPRRDDAPGAGHRRQPGLAGHEPGRGACGGPSREDGDRGHPPDG